MKVLKINDGKNLKIYLKKLHPNIPQKQTKKCKNLMKYLENKNQYLEAENEYLKKLRAAIQSRKNRQPRKKQR